MSTFGAFFRDFLFGANSAGYRQPNNDDDDYDDARDNDQARRDPDTCSASVNLEDIIDEYDEPSRMSRLTSGLSLNPASDKLLSQSYFSLGSSANINGLGRGLDGSAEARDADETTSFYSALHDGFSLSEFELRNKYGREFLWSTTKNGANNSGTSSNNNRSKNNNNANGEESYPMLRRSDFKVSWHDLTYTVRPRSTLSDAWDELKRKLESVLSSAPRIIGNSCSRSRSAYDVNPEVRNGGVCCGGVDSITILQSVNGSFESGQLTAIMGPSGAGKTSLLNILSRRTEQGFTGSVQVNKTDHRVRINAIPQDDHLLESLTVRENLLFAARLKNTQSNQDHAKNVCNVSDLLGLSDCLDTRTKNISGGQQKRLAIAQELLSKPDILILDEPTSGLDSLTCLKTLAVLNDLVNASRKKMIEPIAIVLTIHQPQQEAFNLFDKVYVMANGGIVIYDGPPSRCTSFIEKHSGLKMPSLDYNPASFLVEIASGEYGQEPIDALAKQVRLEFNLRHSGTDKSLAESASSRTVVNGEKKTTYALQHSISLDIHDKNSRTSVEEQLEPVVEPSHVVDSNVRSNLSSASNPSRTQKPRLFLDPQLVRNSSVDSGRFFLKTRILTERCWKTLTRDPKQIAARILFHIFLPFFLAFIMGRTPGSANTCPLYSSEFAIKKMISSDEYISPDRQEEFLLGLENQGSLFIAIYACISANIAAMTLMFSFDLKTCLKEYYNGWYSMNSFVFARMISNLPLDLILPTITVALTYIVTGQDTGNGDLSDVYRIIISACGIVLASGAGQILGMIFATIYVGHLTTALFASQGATLPFVLLSGFVARTKNMSKFVRALSVTSLYKHGLEITYIARYGWNVCDCDPKKVDGTKPALTGVTEELRNFVKYWMSSQEDDEASSTTTELSSQSAALGTIEASTNETSSDDIFQMIAKQIQLYNTYGIEVRSCNEVKPYQLYDFGLTESDLPASFLALITLLITMLLVLLLVIKLITSYRTSL